MTDRSSTETDERSSDCSSSESDTSHPPDLYDLKVKRVKKLKSLLHQLRRTTCPELYFDRMRRVILFYNANRHLISHGDIIHRALTHDLPFGCFRRGVMDSLIVFKVIRCLCDLDCARCGGIKNFASSVIRACDAEDPVWIPGDFSTESKPYNLLSYFLYHTTASRLTFEGKRFTHILTEVCKAWELISLNNRWKDETFLSMLQYGTWLYGETECRTDAVQRLCGKSIANFMNDDHYFLSFLDDQSFRTNDVKMTSWRKRLKLFLINLANPHTMTLRVCGKFSLFEADAMRKIYDRLFPGMELGRARPPSLIHCARFHIRKLLHANWQLPSGIHRLRIPATLQDYVNLVRDL